MKVKVGIGYDIHKLTAGGKLILGGTLIPFHKGLVGHSDADVLLHAVADSIFGALGLPDIGRQFPDDADWTENIDSKTIINHARDEVTSHGYAISNVDAVIIAQEPKLAGYIDEIRSSLAEILLTDVCDIGLKAKTNEGVGEIGNCAAIAAISTCLLVG